MITLEKEIIKEVDKIAVENNRSRSNMIETIIKEYLKDNKDE